MKKQLLIAFIAIVVVGCKKEAIFLQDHQVVEQGNWLPEPGYYLIDGKLYSLYGLVPGSLVLWDGSGDNDEILDDEIKTKNLFRDALDSLVRFRYKKAINNDSELERMFLVSGQEHLMGRGDTSLIRLPDSVSAFYLNQIKSGKP